MKRNRNVFMRNNLNYNDQGDWLYFEEGDRIRQEDFIEALTKGDEDAINIIEEIIPDMGGRGIAIKLPPLNGFVDILKFLAEHPSLRRAFLWITEVPDIVKKHFQLTDTELKAICLSVGLMEYMDQIGEMETGGRKEIDVWISYRCLDLMGVSSHQEASEAIYEFASEHLMDK